MRNRWIMGAVVATTLAGAAEAKRPMTTDDLLAVKSVGDPQLSPDGSRVAYVVSEVDKDAGKSNSSLWLVPTAGGEPTKLTSAPGANNHPRWSPDGKTIAFVSSRGGSSQVWLLPIDGGEARQLTKLPIDVDGPVWSPKGDRIAFAAQVYPGTTPEETAAKDKEKEEAKSKVRVYDDLMVRHWSEWDSGKRSHLFVADAKTGEAVDLTPKLAVNTPPAPFGGSSDYAWSADGQSLAFTAEPTKDRAWSTNTDIWRVPVGGGEPENLTAANEAADASPSFSPDGKHMAYISQSRPGFEADLWVLRVRDLATGETRDVSSFLDRPVQGFAWKDAGTVVASIDDGGRVPVVVLPIGGDGSKVERLATEGVNTGVSVGPEGEAIAFVHHAADRPAEIHYRKAGEEARALTSHNAPLLSQLDLAPMESFTFKGAGGDEVQGWLMKPPGFEAGKKYPVLFLIHGGPQGAWHDEWHARWNYALFSAPGYALVAINPRGSTGFGQKFTDEISRDWTGKVYDDLMAGLDHALGKYDFLDGKKLAAAGGSFGGYMVNWICGQTDRFKALISHAGVFDLVSMYGTTEELWFPDWEYGGPPWKELQHYLDRSPSLFADKFKTPTLVIHGALDFRVPDAQGLGMFTSLRRVGVPSRYVWFPDEGHWILKPANRIVWWREMHDWLAKYLK
ncbi:S9 family peptidase [Paludisphaera sp.]|uniref:S9 family peptidase n=1 Tax=Paludisphaera sp. TaxID=2017432 RepID=UPI00301E36DD